MLEKGSVIVDKLVAAGSSPPDLAPALVSCYTDPTIMFCLLSKNTFQLDRV